MVLPRIFRLLDNPFVLTADGLVYQGPLMDLFKSIRALDSLRSLNFFPEKSLLLVHLSILGRYFLALPQLSQFNVAVSQLVLQRGHLLKKILLDAQVIQLHCLQLRFQLMHFLLQTLNDRLFTLIAWNQIWANLDQYSFTFSALSAVVDFFSWNRCSCSAESLSMLSNCRRRAEFCSVSFSLCSSNCFNSCRWSSTLAANSACESACFSSCAACSSVEVRSSSFNAWLSSSNSDNRRLRSSASSCAMKQLIQRQGGQHSQGWVLPLQRPGRRCGPSALPTGRKEENQVLYYIHFDQSICLPPRAAVRWRHLWPRKPNAAAPTDPATQLFLLQRSRPRLYYPNEHAMPCHVMLKRELSICFSVVCHTFWFWFGPVGGREDSC